jgi:uncharacterized membrane protein YsdA (DUF1294 family)
MLELLWAVVLLWNVVTVVVFGWDKWRSKRNGENPRSDKQRRRVPESTLLWMVFLTGWFGAWLALAWFRHKTQKRSFRVLATVLTIVNPFWALVWWTLRGDGTA